MNHQTPKNYTIMQIKRQLLMAMTLVALGSFAQGGLPREYNVSYLDLSAGLPTNFVDDIFRDSYGFMWISTHGGGLVRYDGYGFTDFGLGSTTIGLRSNSCRNVCEDHFKRLWVAFEEGPQVVNLVTLQPTMPACADSSLEKLLDESFKEGCTRVYCDTKGHVWMLTRARLYRFAFNASGAVNSILSTPCPFNAPDLGLADVFRRGTVVLCNNGKVSELTVKGNKLEARDLTTMFAPLGNRYATGFAVYNGRLWMATNNGLFCSDKRAFHGQPADMTLQHEMVTGLAVSPDDKLLVGTLCGVDVIDDKQGQTEHWNTGSMVNPLSSNFINCLFAEDGQVWVGTETGGITKLTPRLLQLEYYRHVPGDASSLSRNAVNAIYTEEDGTLWVGTVEGGLNRQSPHGVGFEHYTTANSRLPHNSVSTLVADGSGHLWIGTWGRGVAVMPFSQPGEMTRIEEQNPLLYFVGALAYDAMNGGMWIGTNDGVFFYDQKQNRLTEPFPGCRDVRGCIGSLITTSGELLMGCVQGLVEVDLKSRHRTDGTFTVKRHPYKLDNPKSGVIDKILSLCQTKDGRIWMGSNGYGMYCYNYDKDGESRVKAFTTDNGLANNTVKGIAEDRDGMLWVATDNGLSIFNPKNETFSRFTKEDGLMSTQFYFNGAVCSKSGTIYLGTDAGMMAVNSINHAAYNPGTLRFTRLLVDNQPVYAGSGYLDEDISIAKKVCLHESDKSFTISFSALNYSNETQGMFLYRMRGYESDWTSLPSGQHSVRYSTLPAGNYEFEVKYISSFGTGQEQVISVPVSVTPYFWKSWWFLTLVLIGIVVVGRRIYLRRLAVMREREAVALYRPIEAALKDSDDPDKLQSRIQVILENQRRYHESQVKTIEADKQEVEKNTKSFMAAVMEIMEENYGNSEFGVHELAKSMGMNRSALSKRLNAECGLPTAQFIRDYRLDVAKKMIAKNFANRNITEIAYRVGFNDPKYFTRCFTHHYGVSPSSYKGALDTD